MTTTVVPGTDLTPTVRLAPVATLPNLVTLARTTLAVTTGCLGVALASVPLLVVAYAAYWVGDVADGWLARRRGQETRFGAVLDIVCDRVCTVLLCTGLLVVLPSAGPVVMVFLVSFGVVDTMLSLAFLCWPVEGPNDFWQVDRRTFLWNWSPPAKAANTAGVVLALLLGQAVLALLLALAVLTVKVASAVRVMRMLS